jgi:hypothetical protein
VSRTWVSPEGQPVWLFYLTEHLRNGLGTGLEVIALGGIIYAMAKRLPQDWILLAFPLPLFLTLAKGENFARYALLLLPFLVIAAARLIYDVTQWAELKWSRHWTWAVIVFAVGLVVPSGLNIARYDFMITQPDTRTLAAQWIDAHIPDGATIAVEGAGVLGPVVPARPNQPDGRTYQVDTVFRLDQRHEGGILVGSISSADYYASRGIDYLVTVNWMQGESESGYSKEFQDSLEADYAPIAEFAPTIDFRFDPYAWRMDYNALAQVIPGKPETGGPRLTVYRRRPGLYSRNNARANGTDRGTGANRD